MAYVGRMGVMSALWGASVLVYRSLHLLEDVVQLLKVVLGPQIVHRREIVMLGEGPMGGPGPNGQSRRSCSHVFGRQAAILNAERGVEW